MTIHAIKHSWERRNWHELLSVTRPQCYKDWTGKIITNSTVCGRITFSRLDAVSDVSNWSQDDDRAICLSLNTYIHILHIWSHFRLQMLRFFLLKLLWITTVFCTLCIASLLLQVPQKSTTGWGLVHSHSSLDCNPKREGGEEEESAKVGCEGAQHFPALC